MAGDDFQKGHGNLSDEITEIRNSRINSIKSKQEELDNLRETVLGQEVDYWFKQIRSAILSKIRKEEVSKIVYSGPLKWPGTENPPFRKGIERLVLLEEPTRRYEYVIKDLTFFNHLSTAVMWKGSTHVSGEKLYAKEITAMQIHEELMKKLKSEGLDIKSQWTESIPKTDWKVRRKDPDATHYELQIEIRF
ncbi:hypothetical protein OAV46_05275 [Euryarchaeota archaeon]|nr:hypothetical protein [Euryarchaeota archaeon]